MVKNIGVFKDFEDDSIKSVFSTLNGNKIVEMTLLQNKDFEDVICVPTHHYCNLGCKMCHLTNNKLNKEMVPINIDDFIDCLIFSLKIQNTDTKRTNKKRLLISFMGVGEPLLNIKLIEELYKREYIIKKVLGYESIGYALSTMMPNQNLKELEKFVLENKMPLKVHFSMHTPLDFKRKELLPSTKVSVLEAMDELKEYEVMVKNDEEIMAKHKLHHKTTDVTEVHYTLIDKVNDSDRELSVLTRMLISYKTPIKFIRFNPTEVMAKSNKEKEWVEYIKKQIPSLKVKTYTPPGKNIGASCGEFTKHYYHEELETEEEKTEFLNWKNLHQIYESQRKDNISWDEYFMAVAKLTSMRSKDPNTQVGAVIVSEDNRILSIGYNGSPNGYEDEMFPWTRVGDKLNTKYLYVVHAERNAILNYRGNRRDFENAKIYVDLFPCNECAKEIIQSGIKEVVYLSDKYANTEETIASKRLFDVCGVKYRQINEEKVLTLKLSNK